MVDHRVRAQDAGQQTHHPVADREFGDVRADLQDAAGALRADPRAAGISAERDQDVTEVQPGSAHRDPHLARCQGRGGLGSGQQRDVVDAAGLGDVQAPGCGRGRRFECVLGAYRGQPRRQDRAVAQRELRFADGQRRGHRRGRVRVSVQVEEA
jgi:hypothetical protein